MDITGMPNKYIEKVVSQRFEEFNFPLIIDHSIVPKDDTTLFICSGMQQFKNRFKKQDGSHQGSLQSCIRTNDLGLVGDGTHLTYFEMLGNFSFGGCDYEESVELWHLILRDLNIDITSVHVHPIRSDLRHMWVRRGYLVIDDKNCVWSDGDISGKCCEVFCGDIEIGNLVNPLLHSTDVGFGWERLHQIYENKSRIDQTSLFINHHPIVADHSRAILAFYENDIEPSNKGRGYVCRRMIRRMLPLLNGDESFIFNEWINQEKRSRENCIKKGRRAWRKNREKPTEWWWDTFGILEEELVLLEN